MIPRASQTLPAAATTPEVPTSTTYLRHLQYFSLTTLFPQNPYVGQMPAKKDSRDRTKPSGVMGTQEAHILAVLSVALTG